MFPIRSNPLRQFTRKIELPVHAVIKCDEIHIAYQTFALKEIILKCLILFSVHILDGITYAVHQNPFVPEPDTDRISHLICDIIYIFLGIFRIAPIHGHHVNQRAAYNDQRKYNKQKYVIPSLAVKPAVNFQILVSVPASPFHILPLFICLYHLYSDIVHNFCFNFYIKSLTAAPNRLYF